MKFGHCITISALICFRLIIAQNNDTIAANNDTSSANNDTSSANNDTSSANNDTSSANNDTTSANNDTTTANNNTTTANNERNNPLEPDSTTAAQSPCPRYSTRYENNNRNLIISYLPGVCDMVVQAEGITDKVRGPKKLFGPKNKRNERTTIDVSYRRLDGMPDECETLPIRSAEPFVFVDTVPEQCQILLAVRQTPSEPEDFILVPDPKTGKGKRRPKDKGKRRPKDKGKRRPKDKGKRGPKGRNMLIRSRVPIFAYLDNFIF